MTPRDRPQERRTRFFAVIDASITLFDVVDGPRVSTEPRDGKIRPRLTRTRPAEPSPDAASPPKAGHP
jgi:hypothetical protein